MLPKTDKQKGLEKQKQKGEIIMGELAYEVVDAVGFDEIDKIISELE